MAESSSVRSSLPPFLKSSQIHNDSPNNADVNETSRLLPSHNDGYEDGDLYDPDEEKKPAREKILKEFLVLLRGSVPVILAYTLQMSLQTASVVIVGRRSPEDLATAAFSYMFAMSTGWLIALGGTTALDTLCSSSFTGGKNPHDLGVLLQRAFIVLGLLYVPVAVLWIFSEPVFRLLGQDDQLSRASAKFLQSLAPGGLGYIYFECMKKFLQAQGVNEKSQTKAQLIVFRNHAARDLCSSDYFSN